MLKTLADIKNRSTRVWILVSSTKFIEIDTDYFINLDVLRDVLYKYLDTSTATIQNKHLIVHDTANDNTPKTSYPLFTRAEFDSYINIRHAMNREEAHVTH